MGAGQTFSSLFWRLKALHPERALFRARRALLIGRARLDAVWHRVDLVLDLPPDLRVGRRVRIQLMPQTASTVRVGPRSSFGDGVLLRLNGGTIDLGPETELRKDVVLNVAGHLRMVRHNILSWGVILHCGESVELDTYASVAEQVTIADSTHFFTEPDAFFYDNTRTSPIRIGANTWLCPKSTITAGVTVGSHCIVASNSVVTRDVPDGHLASGVPVSTMRPLELPWRDARPVADG